VSNLESDGAKGLAQVMEYEIKFRGTEIGQSGRNEALASFM